MAKNHDQKYRAVFKTGVALSPLLLRKYSFRTDRVPEMHEPFLMLANHTTESDFLMAARAAHTPMDIVCGEHLLRGRFGKVIQWLCDPIPEPKGASSLPAVKEILRRLRSRHSVLLFPEGCRSFHGETLPLDRSIGKLVKMSGAALVTYRLQGGYFVAPRWAYHFRRGPVRGQVMRILSSEELRHMSVQEVTDIINCDLYENAYETQKQSAHPYKDRRLAEGLENYLVICPHCGCYDTLKTKGNAFHCACCGYGGVMCEYGFLWGRNLKFNTVYDWGKWMEQRFDEDRQRRPANSVFFQENAVQLYEIDLKQHCRHDVQTGSLQVYRDRLEMDGYVFLFSDIPRMAMLYYGKTLLFTCGKNYYGITGEAFHAWKIDRLYRSYQAERK